MLSLALEVTKQLIYYPVFRQVPRDHNAYSSLVKSKVGCHWEYLPIIAKRDTLQREVVSEVCDLEAEKVMSEFRCDNCLI